MRSIHSIAKLTHTTNSLEKNDSESFVLDTLCFKIHYEKQDYLLQFS